MGGIKANFIDVFGGVRGYLRSLQTRRVESRKKRGMEYSPLPWAGGALRISVIFRSTAKLASKISVKTKNDANLGDIAENH